MPDGDFIEVRRLSRRYGRRHAVWALRDISITVRHGECVAFVGPNGAGKSTLFGLLPGFIRPTSGDVTMAQIDPRDYVRESGIGYLPDRFHLPPEWPADYAIRTLTAMSSVRPERDTAERETFGVADLGRKRIGDLSRGTLQRVGLAIAFAADRSLIILDEPGQGLDPVWQYRLSERIAAARAAEQTVLFASHDIAEVERVADTVVILESGTIRDIIDMRAAPEMTAYTITVETGHDALASAFITARRIAVDTFAVDVADAGELNQRVADAIGAGARIVSITRDSPSLRERIARGTTHA